MLTKLYDYQEETANNIFERIDDGEIKGAYLGFDTRLCLWGQLCDSKSKWYRSKSSYIYKNIV